MDLLIHTLQIGGLVVLASVLAVVALAVYGLSRITPEERAHLDDMRVNFGWDKSREA